MSNPFNIKRPEPYKTIKEYMDDMPELDCNNNPIMSFDKPAAEGRKDDGGKLDLTLLFDDCPHALEAIAEVMQWAVTKKQPTPYARGSWQGVAPFQQRYRGAAMRHELNAAKAALGGSVGTPEEARDGETGLLELAHIATNAVFRLEMAVRKLKGIK